MGSVVLIDQFSKFLALRYLSPQASVPLIPKILDLTLVHNSGVAFGLFSGHTPVLLTVITASLVILFLVVNRSHGAGGRGLANPERWALSMILGGAIGNWIDRVRFGAVIDFLDFRIWPVFNIADTAITVGVGLYLIHALRSKDPS